MIDEHTRHRLQLLHISRRALIEWKLFLQAEAPRVEEAIKTLEQKIDQIEHDTEP